MRLSSKPRLNQEEEGKRESRHHSSGGGSRHRAIDSSSSIHTPGTTGNASHWLLSPWVITLGLFLVALFFTTRHNDYPFYYEKDAHSKVAQVVTGKRNFYHPPLMLNAADAVLRITGKEFTNENAILAGRFCMAFFTSSAIAAFALLGYRLTGPGGAIAVGVLLLTHSLVFDLSHHFKEDPALIFGLGLSFLAMQLFWEKRSVLTSTFMGIAAALAVSGKYVGIATLPMALVLLILARKELRLSHWISFFAGYLCTIAIVDYQFVMQLGQFKAGFKTEMADLTRKDKIHEIPRFNEAFYTLKRFIARALFVTMLVYVYEQFVTHRRNPVRWLITLYPIVFLNVLVWSPRLFTRHFLPVLVLLLVWVGLTIPTYARWIRQANDFLQNWRPQNGNSSRFDKILLPLQRYWLAVPFLKGRRIPLLPAALVLTGISVYVQQSSLRRVYTSYSNPTREQLVAYINKNLPKEALIVFDQRVFLLDNHHKPRTDHPIHCDAITKGRLSSFKSLDEIYATGATHIAAHNIDSRYLFFEKTNMKKNAKADESVLEEIHKTAKEICFVPPGLSIYIAPGLLLYELPPRPGQETRPRINQESFHLPDAAASEGNETQTEE